ncbi:hypothetical protein PsorP6_009707 [Peronosclerospora sorghi]|uniref:Uncharacterized protein n=1 Tax=Peronosclerospora sorghi TaxID=230839 RepID=A0ACC0VYH9_9STRA|nr:hypothetical protein PsorP6_009707 [Peronosclerospora sorghi]
MKSVDVVDMDAFEFAKDKILMGEECRSALITPELAKVTAYHEGGHALVAIKTPGAHPVYKATIIPRGQALGMVSQLPEDDQPRFRESKCWLDWMYVWEVVWPRN